LANGDTIPIKLRAIYDVIQVAEATNANSMKLTISIRRKDNYTDSGVLPINEYITDLVIGDRNYSASAEYVSSISTSSAASSTSYVYIINNPKTVLTYVEQNNRAYYEIPITFSAYTGTGDYFEGDNTPSDKYYSNYMIHLKAELYYNQNCVGYIDSTQDGDHIIWTNAKILTDIIK
jgi:hypothetical protein